MMTMGLLAMLAGCTSGNKALGDLAGTWSGTATDALTQAVYPLSGSFTFQNEEFLQGTATVTDPLGTLTYNVRTATVYPSVTAIDLQTVDLIYNLDLDGNYADGSFTGLATMTTVCPGGVGACGWQGNFSLTKTGTLVTTQPPPPTVTNPPPPPPTDTAPTDTGPKDTGPKDTAPPNDTAAR